MALTKTKTDPATKSFLKWHYNYRQDKVEEQRLARLRRNVILNGIYILIFTVFIILIFGGVL